MAFSQVALFTRAWIEIITANVDREVYGSPSSRGRGLKSCGNGRYSRRCDGRPLHEGVD